MDTLLRSARVRRTIHEIRRLTRQGTADQLFLDEVSHLLREIVPFDAAFWAAADPLTTLATSPTLVEGFPSDDTCHRYWQAEFLVEDVNRFGTLARAATPAASLYEATCGKPVRSHRYHLNLHYGYGDELRGVFRVGSGAWGLVCLLRGAGNGPFSPAEIQLLTDLSAPVGHTFQRSALLQGKDVLDLPELLGLLMFDQSGAVESMNDAAELWLAELPRPRFSLAGGTVPVPTELLVVAHRARATAAGHNTGTPRVRGTEPARPLARRARIRAARPYARDQPDGRRDRAGNGDGHRPHHARGIPTRAAGTMR